MYDAKDLMIEWCLEHEMALAHFVKQTGDNNWPTISRCLKRRYPHMSASTFTAQQCCLHYGSLIERYEIDIKKNSGEPLANVLEQRLMFDTLAEKRIETIREFRLFKRIYSCFDRLLSAQSADQLSSEIDQIVKEAGESGELDDYCICGNDVDAWIKPITDDDRSSCCCGMTSARKRQLSGNADDGSAKQRIVSLTQVLLGLAHRTFVQWTDLSDIDEHIKQNY